MPTCVLIRPRGPVDAVALPCAQGQAPKPTSNDVEVVKYPAVTVYVSQFGGFASEPPLWNGSTKRLKTGSCHFQRLFTAQPAMVHGGFVRLPPADAFLHVVADHVGFCSAAAEQNLLKKAALLSEALKTNGEDVETDFFVWTGWVLQLRLHCKHRQS